MSYVTCVYKETKKTNSTKTKPDRDTKKEQHDEPNQRREDRDFGISSIGKLFTINVVKQTVFVDWIKAKTY